MVRSVEVDGVMALVEIEAGPHLVTAAVTRDAVEELGLAPGVPATAAVKATSVMVERDEEGSGRSRAAGARSRAGAGDDDDEASGAPGKPRLVVSAAASMTEALERCSPDFAGATVRLSFAGSDELAAQIRQGVKPDVYAAANTRLPDELQAEGLLGEPVEFATNEFVLAVPEDSDIASVWTT